MPRPPKFSITKVTGTDRKTRYRIFIPARFSKSGKKTALYYKSRSDARQDQLKLLDRFSAGVIGSEFHLTSAQMDDVAKAYGLIQVSGISISLADAVALAIEKSKERLQGILVREFLEKYRSTVSIARHWSPKQAANWKFYASKFESEFGNDNIADIHQHRLDAWMKQQFPSAVYFNSAMSVLSPAFTWAVKQEILTKSPFSFIERRKMVKANEIDVFSIDEAKRLFSCCVSYKGESELAPIMRLDCSDAVVPFAFLLFAGIRPEELVKLEWRNVRLADGYIHVTPEAAKTNQVRHVVIMDNLATWIKTIPAKKRIGKIVPSNWKRKSYLVRKMAGLQNRHDTARHSFASYFLALFPDVDKLRENMGHVCNSDMLFKHYRAAVSKEDAKDYFEIIPNP